MRNVKAVTSAVSATTPHHARPASFPARALTAPLVFICTHRAPCIMSASKANTPTRMVYQSRMPVSSPRRKLVHSGSKKYREQQARCAKQKIPKGIPNRALDVIPEFDRRSAQNQQPQHNHQRQIKSAERAGVQRGKCEVQSSARRNQPHFVSVPYRADARQDLPTLLIRFCHKKMNRPRAQIEPIQEHVRRDHDCYQPEPDRSHRALLNPPQGRLHLRRAEDFPAPARVRSRDKSGTATESPAPYTSP